MKKIKSSFNSLRVILAVLTLFACAAVKSEQSSIFQPLETEKGNVNAVLRTATIYVKDWDASIKFYTHYLGYETLGILPVEDKKSLKTIGVEGDVQARIAYLKANSSLIDRPYNGSYLGLIELSGQDFDNAVYERKGESSAAVLGEIVLAHQVVGIDEIYDAMLKGGINIISSLGRTSRGAARSFSAIDPNGIRIEIYEYLDGLEPTEDP